MRLHMQQSPPGGTNTLPAQNASVKNFKLAPNKQKMQELISPYQEPLPETLRKAFNVQDTLHKPQIENLPTTLSNNFHLSAAQFAAFPNQFMGFPANAMPFPTMSNSKGSDMTSQMKLGYGAFLQTGAFGVQPNLSESLREHAHMGQRDISSQGMLKYVPLLTLPMLTLFL